MTQLTELVDRYYRVTLCTLLCSEGQTIEEHKQAISTAEAADALLVHS